jgi:hypothetical protein
LPVQVPEICKVSPPVAAPIAAWRSSVGQLTGVTAALAREPGTITAVVTIAAVTEARMIRPFPSISATIGAGRRRYQQLRGQVPPGACRT